jgi:hypothetical protein
VKRRGYHSIAGAARVLTVAAVLLTVSPPAEAANEALLRLLQVLRDRGSISADEYEEIRKVAVAPEAQTPPEGRLGALEDRVATQEKSVAGLKALTEGTPSPVVTKALAGKWYERIGLRGYTQLRYSDVLSHDGLPLEVPNDRSVNDNESFMIRRGRFVFSGDVSDRLALYAQSDFNGSTGAADFSVQMRDLYGDIAFDTQKSLRLRVGQSKVPFGWVNLQSSQNRAPLERPDALNSAVEGERDLGASLMWSPSAARQHFRDIAAQGLKGTGDYGMLTFGAFAGQGLNRSDQNGDPHVVARVAYPLKLASGQFAELGVQAYHGRFVVPTQSLTVAGAAVTPVQDAEGPRDQRVALTAIWYPQPLGLEAEWTFGRGPALSVDSRRIESRSLHGGHVQVNYRRRNSGGTWFPFTRWSYFDGARKFARNAPRSKVNEVDFGLEFAKWNEVEVTAMFTRTLTRTRTGSFPYGQTLDANRLGLQVQWNY